MKWRREKVWELKAMGCTIDEIVDILKQNNQSVRISHGTVCRDLEAKGKEIREGFQRYITEELPTQHRLAVTGLDKIIKESWRIYAKAEDQKSAIAALNVAREATMNKQAVLGDPVQIEKAIKLVGKLRASVSNEHSEEKTEAVQ